MKPLLKYKIGLAVLGILMLGLVGVVVAQSSAVKEDNQTSKAAGKIADKLNEYTMLRDQVPSSLSVIGIKDVPDTVSYTKLSSSRYKFCVTYKSDSSGFDPASIETQLLTGGAASDFSSQQTDKESSYLFMYPTHRKGENCQNIKLYSSSYFDDLNDNSLFNSDSTYDSQTLRVN